MTAVLDYPVSSATVDSVLQSRDVASEVRSTAALDRAILGLHGRVDNVCVREVGLLRGPRVGVFSLEDAEPDSASVFRTVYVNLRAAAERASSVFAQQELLQATLVAPEAVAVLQTDSSVGVSRDEMRVLLEHVQSASSNRAARIAASELARFLLDESSDAAQQSVGAFLLQQPRVRAAILLASFADAEVELRHPELLQAVTSCLKVSDVRLAHAATMALYFGGPLAIEELRVAMKQLSAAGRQEVAELLAHIPND